MKNDTFTFWCMVIDFDPHSWRAQRALQIEFLRNQTMNVGPSNWTVKKYHLPWSNFMVCDVKWPLLYPSNIEKWNTMCGFVENCFDYGEKETNWWYWGMKFKSQILFDICKLIFFQIGVYHLISIRGPKLTKIPMR